MSVNHHWVQKHVFYRNYLWFICVMINLMILRHPEQVLARPVDLMRRFQLEQFRALLRVEENSKGKTTRHWLWRVKDIPHAAWSWTCERRTCCHGATKMFKLIEFIDVLLSHDMKYYICLTSLTRAKPKEKNEICRSVSTRAVKCDGVFFVLQHGFRYGFQHA